MKSDTTTNAISSPESADGLSPCDGPDSKTPEESGPAPVPVSRFRALEKDRDTPTSGTCGPLFTASSPSAVLQRSLESKLRARMDVNGSPEFALTWKTWDMPAGEPICALRASERRTAGKGCIGEQGAWMTPKAHDGEFSTPRTTGRPMHRSTHLQTQTLAVLTDKDPSLTGWRSPQASDGEGGVMEIRPDCAGKYKLLDEAELVGWPTPQANKNTKNSKDPQRMKENGAQTCLADAAHLAGWPTASARDWKDTPGMSMNGVNPDGTERKRLDMLPRVAQLASWPTPQAHDTQEQGQAREMTATGRIKTHTGSDVSANLPMVAGWATPKCADGRGDPYDPTENRRSELRKQMPSAQAGQDASRSNAATARPAGFRLNPRFSLWLMGYPAEWASCGERAMQSCQKSRRRS